jgi:hypothetical protein
MPDDSGQQGGDGFLASLGLRRATPAETPPAEGSGSQGGDPPTGGAQPQQPQGDSGPQGDPPLGEAGKAALERERAARREAEVALKKVTDAVEFERAQAHRSEREKLEAEATRAREEAKAATDTLLRIRVGAQKKLSPELASRLQGATEQEMTEDADRLLEAISPQAASGFDGGAQAPSGQAKSPGDAHNELILGLTGRLPQQPT